MVVRERRGEGGGGEAESGVRRRRRRIGVGVRGDENDRGTVVAEGRRSGGRSHGGEFVEG